MVNIIIENVAVFKETQKACEKDRELSLSIIKSQANTKYISSEELRKTYGRPMEWEREYDTVVTFSDRKTLSAAESFARNGQKTAVLNFANSIHPGGGVTHGAIAQEEDLCRSSTLYPVLSSRFGYMPLYYREGAKLIEEHQIGEAAMMYTPNIIVFRSDMEDYRFFDASERFKVDVITCAAPCLRHPGDIPGDEQEKVHRKLGRAVLNIAKERGAEAIVLGAFGCGAFHNDPYAVASAYSGLVKEFSGCFREIHFAIYGKNDNLSIFRSVIRKDS